MATNASITRKAIEESVALFPGPGGAVAVVKDGSVVETYVHGFADLEKRIAMTTKTLLPICSITKQMVCYVLLTLSRNDDSFSDKLHIEVQKLFVDPLSSDKELTVEHLAHMQSGIRDYWALTVLWGATPGDKFSVCEDGEKARKRLGNFHFRPGTQSTYCNLNYHVLGRAMENVTGVDLSDLLDEHVFGPAGMITAKLCPDTANQPGDCVGHEGRPETGLFRDRNAMCWSGDAGVVASLEDMIAYEKFLDLQYADSDSVYREMTKTQTFSDGNKATYRYGLMQSDLNTLELFGHSGGLPGYTLFRVQVPEHRLSVVVMRNSQVKTTEQAKYIIRKILAIPQDTKNQVAARDLDGVYFAEHDRLAIKVRPGKEGQLAIDYQGGADDFTMISASTAVCKYAVATFSGEDLHISDSSANAQVYASRLNTDRSAAEAGHEGMYHSAEIDSTLYIYGSGGTLYGTFKGYLGHGPGHLMKQLARDVWVLECPRSLDLPSPGDWTVVFDRHADGDIRSVSVSCWIARNVHYVKKNDPAT